MVQNRAPIPQKQDTHAAVLLKSLIITQTGTALRHPICAIPRHAHREDSVTVCNIPHAAVLIRNPETQAYCGTVHPVSRHDFKFDQNLLFHH